MPSKIEALLKAIWQYNTVGETLSHTVCLYATRADIPNAMT